MSHMSVLRFTRDEDGRDKVCQDVVIAAAHAKNYPWPPSEAMVRVQFRPKDSSDDDAWDDVQLYGQDASVEPEEWAETLKVIRLALNDRRTDPDTELDFRCLHFRRHSFSQVDPREEVTKGNRHIASGAQYVLVEELEPLEPEVEVKVYPLAEVKKALQDAIKADPVPRKPITEQMIGKALDEGWISHPEAQDVRYLIKRDRDERTCLSGEPVIYYAGDRALIPGHIATQLQAKEYEISRYCGHCWDRMFSPGWTDPITGAPGETPVEEESDV